MGFTRKPGRRVAARRRRQRQRRPTSVNLLTGVESLERRQVMAADIPAGYVPFSTVVVLTDGSSTAPVTVQLPAGQLSYYLVASGGGGISANRALDAEYAQSRVNGPWADAGGADWGVRGGGVSKWGAYQADHVYGQLVTASSESVTLSFSYSDDYYADNSGAVSVAIWIPSSSPTAPPPTVPPTQGEPGGCGCPDGQAVSVFSATGESLIQCGVAASASTAGLTPPVRLQLNQASITSSGLGASASNGTFGIGWSRTDTAQLVMQGSDPAAPDFVSVVFSGTDARVFRRLSGGSFVPANGLGSTDTFTFSGGQYVFRTDSGTTRTFNGFGSSVPLPARGALVSQSDASGNRVDYSFGTDGSVTGLASYVAGQTAAVETQEYVLLPSGNPNAGRVGEIDVRRGGGTLERTVVFSYYDGTTAFGALGQLASITTRDAAGMLLDAWHYRYAVAPSGASMLQYALNADAVRRATAAGLDPLTASNAAITPFATNYLEYDAWNRVTRNDVQGAGCSSCSGGIGTFSFAYATNPASGIREADWRTKTTITRPDGTEQVDYANGRMQPMLQVLRTFEGATTRQFGTYTRYDGRGQAIWTVTPDAVQLPADLAVIEQYGDLLHEVNNNFEFIKDNDGLIQVTNYATATTATATTGGSVDRYTASMSVMRGDLGSQVYQSAYTYVIQSAGGSVVVPRASMTTYRSTTATGAQVTTYGYQFAAGTTQIVSQSVSKPIALGSQNGSGTSDVTTTFFDASGRPVWTRDADGFLRYTEYDQTTGAVVKTIADVNTTISSSFQNLPSGWSTPAGGGLHLVTAYEVDAFGRTTKMTDANGSVTYTVYDDVNHASRTYRGWSSVTNLPTGPIEDWRRDLSGNYTESLTFAATPAVDGAGRPTGTEAITNIQSLSRTIMNAAGQRVAEDQYTDLTGVTYSTSATLGAEGVNYLRTRYAYSNQGKVDRIQNPAGTITLYRHDGLARTVATYVGTDDSTTDGYKWNPSNASATSNMVLISTNEYDDGGVGNGNLTSVTQYPGGGADPRTTDSFYDWRDRLVATKSGATATPASEDLSVNRSLTFTVYDNLSRVTGQSVYDGDGVTIVDANGDGVPDAPDAALLRSSRTLAYDTQDRVYRTTELQVDQTTGAIGTGTLVTNLFYDRRGNVIMRNAPTSPVVQQRYDGAGRLIVTYTLGNVPGTSWGSATVLTNSVVVEQTENTYDGVGNVILSTTRQRFHDVATTTKGALGTPTTGTKARVSFIAAYFDAANRMTASVNVGTNGGTAYVRPSTVPARSDTVLVTGYGFDDGGRVQDVTDPRGIVTRTVHDLLGRTTASILNYTGGAPGAQSDVTTTFQFDAAGRLASRTAVQPSGTPSQVTGYVYGVSPTTGSAMASNDVVATTKYPDRVTGLPSSTDVETYTVNALGERLSITDRAGTTRAYTRNVVGRQTADTVVTLGSGVNGDIRRIEATYETLGQMASTTSFDAVTGGTARNQVARVFAGFGRIASEAQAHTGLVDSATPKVQYQWSQGVGGNFDRLTKTVYPDGYEVTVVYTGIDSAMSRITSLSGVKASDGTAVVLESQKYLGASTVIDRSRPEVNVNLTLVNPSGTAGSAGDKYTGIDRFGRVVDQRWVQGSGTSAPDVDRLQYTYDRNGNRLTATNALNATFNETYTYDALNQIQSFARGSTSSPSATQAWQFDALGNWTTLTTNGTPESRTANAQNELTNVGAATLGYSATGNLTTDATGKTLEYDAWNRLVKVTSADTLTWTAYTYDGLNHRVTDTFGPGPVTTTRDIYYSLQWQAVEERVRDGSGAIPATADTRYMWSPVYVDAMIARDRNADSSGTTGTGGLEERVYALQDSNWNTTAIVAASGVTGFTTGSVINRFVYTPFGVSQALTASWVTPMSAPATAWAHLFQGLKFNETTGLTHVRYRDYSATLGRFIERDPIGFKAGDNNWYRFVRNSPIAKTDANGLGPPPGSCVLTTSSGNAWITCTDLGCGTVTIVPPPAPPAPPPQAPRKRDCILETGYCMARGVIVCQVLEKGLAIPNPAVYRLCMVVYATACAKQAQWCAEWNSAHGF
jgi:RHS repeat-associated protein